MLRLQSLGVGPVLGEHGEFTDADACHLFELRGKARALRPGGAIGKT
jgi:hypothetical protein